MRAGYDGLVEVLGPTMRHTRIAAERLVAFYEAAGQPERAAPYRPPAP